MLSYSEFVEQGWQCPVCHRIYSPLTIMCLYCGNKTETTVATTITSTSALEKNWVTPEQISKEVLDKKDEPDEIRERCESCKHRYALKEYEYSKFGCADTDMPGYICMAFADEGIAIWMVGSSGNGCECFSPKKKTSYHPTESELKIRNYCREKAANIKIKKVKKENSG